MVGFWGTFSALKEIEAGAYAVRKRESHVGSDEQRAQEIIAEAGPNAAVALLRCKDAEIGQAVAAHAADRGRHAWHGSLPKFFAGLDPSASMTGFAQRSTSPPGRQPSRSARAAGRDLIRFCFNAVSQPIARRSPP